MHQSYSWLIPGGSGNTGPFIFIPKRGDIKIINQLLSEYKEIVIMEWLPIIISSGSLLCSALIVSMTKKRDGQTDINKEIRIAESFKELNVKIDFQSKQLDEMATNSRLSTKEMQEMHDKITQLESKLNRAFELIDVLQGKER